MSASTTYSNKHTIIDINKLNYFEFTEVFKSIVEHGHLIAASLFRYLPFKSFTDLYSKLCSIIDDLPIAFKEGLIRCHPQLVSNNSSQLSKESITEQECRFKTVDYSYVNNLTYFNNEYFRKFKFPFICCVRETVTGNIMDAIEMRIKNTIEEEIKNNIQQIKRISFHRLSDLVESPLESNVHCSSKL